MANIENSMKRCCLFCYKFCEDEDAHTMTSAGVTETEVVNDGVEVKRRFFTFLERQENQLAWKKNLEELEEDGGCGTGTCEHCLKLLGSFCDTYHRMKCLELEVNWNLRKVKEVMTLADRVPSRVERFRQVTATTLGIGGEKRGSGAQELRKVVVEMCTRLLHRPQVCVSLKRVRGVTGLLVGDDSPLKKRRKITTDPEPVPQVQLGVDKPSGADDQMGRKEPCIESSESLEEPSPPSSPVSATCGGEDENHDDEMEKEVVCTFPESVSLGKDPIGEDDRDSFCDEEDTLSIVAVVSLAFNDQNKETASDPGKVNQSVPEPETGKDLLLHNCPECGKRFKALKELDEHQAFDHRKPWALPFSYVCPKDKCSAEFIREEELLMHAKLHAEWTCAFCPVVESYAPQLALHEWKDHPPKDGLSRKTKTGKLGKFHCPRCPASFKNENEFVGHHLQSHLSVIMASVLCPVCGKALLALKSVVRGTLRGHMLAAHGKANEDQKNKGEEKKSAAKLTRKGEPRKNKASSFQCDECDIYFRKEFQLVGHKQRVHGVIMKRFKCTDCGNPFLRLRDLAQHRQRMHRTNEADFAFACSVESCPKRFETEVALKGHLRRCRYAATLEEGKLESCPVCGKPNEGGPTSMLIHIEYCQGKRKVQKKGPVMCEQCGKEFKAEWHLSKHMLSHTGPSSWQFSCDECGKKCMDIHKLAEHKRTHSKEKAFVCSECGSAYAHRHNWRNHMKTKHGIDLPDARK